jgi:hypothetical protein
MSRKHSFIAPLAAAAAVLLGMLLFYNTLGAAPPAGQPPFVDATVQREQILAELRSIRELIKEQNALLKESLQKPHGNTPNRR